MDGASSIKTHFPLHDPGAILTRAIGAQALDMPRLTQVGEAASLSIHAEEFWLSRSRFQDNFWLADRKAVTS
jgi:hypothetical protein